MTDSSSLIEAFLAGGPYAVVGASKKRDKFGNKVLRAYLQHGHDVYPVNPSESEIEGQKAYPSLEALPSGVRKISVITPPKITLDIVNQAAAAGIEFIWIQPGAESEEAIARARSLKMKVIAGGPCVLVELGFRE